MLNIFAGLMMGILVGVGLGIYVGAQYSEAPKPSKHCIDGTCMYVWPSKVTVFRLKE